MVNVAGWIVRITTVQTKRWEHRPADRSITSRRPTAFDRMAIATVPDVAPRMPKHNAGPSGTDVSFISVAGAWRRTIDELCWHVARWPGSVLGEPQRMSPGTKAGPRGRAAAA